MSDSYLEVQSQTWEKDTHGLFDYESTNNPKSFFKIINPSTIYRVNSHCYIPNTEPEPGSIPLLKFDQKQKQFTAKLVKNNPEDSLWLVIKSLKSKLGNGLRLRENDWLKLGRVCLKVQKVSCQGKSESDAQSILMQNLNNNIEIQETEEVKESLPCRICLSENEQKDDPLICPCKCSGTMKYIHVNCLKEWIKNKVSARLAEKGLTLYIKDLSCELCNAQLPTFVSHKSTLISLVNINIPDKSFVVLEEYKPENTQRTGLHIISLDPGQTGVIGRGHDSDVKISDISVSRRHCLIKLEDNEFVLEDSKSKFGTLIKLNSQLIIRTGSEITLQINRTVVHVKCLEPWNIKKICCCYRKKNNIEPASYYTQPDLQTSFSEPFSNRLTMNGNLKEENEGGS